MSKLHTAWLRVVSGERRGPAALCLRAVLALMSVPYRIGVGIRNRQFDSGRRPARQLERPVLSVGNVTVGGTGKTPMVMDFARRLHALGAQPTVLLRGYYRSGPVSASAGKDELPQAGTLNRSDEAELLDQQLRGIAQVVADPDRVAAAKFALQRNPSTSVFLLDDGFQHRQVHRDVNIVLVDATNPFGFARLLPRGLLREPVAALRRADAVIVTRADLISPAQRQALDERLTALTGKPPLAHVAFTWTGFVDALGVTHTREALREIPVLPVSGIGNPHAFLQMARQHFATVPGHVILEDHHAYTPTEVLQDFVARAQAAGARALLTTEKDWVKWEPILQKRPLALMVYRPLMSVQYLDGEAEVQTRLRAVART